MKSFKYLVFLFFAISSSVHSSGFGYIAVDSNLGSYTKSATGATPQAACSAYFAKYAPTKTFNSVNGQLCQDNNGSVVARVYENT